MSRIHPARALAVALFAFRAASGQNVANQPPFTATPQQLQEAFKDLHVKEGTEVVVLLEDGQFSFDAHGALTFRYRTIFKALTKDAAEGWATIERTWAPWHEKQPEIRARVVTPDGSVRELDQKTIADAPAGEGQEVLSDERAVKAALPAMAQGSIVEEEIVTRETAALSPAGNTNSYRFGGSAPVQQTRVTASAPPGVSLRWVVKMMPGLSASTRPSADGGTEYLFEQGPMEADKDEPPFLPPDQPRYPHLELTTGREWHDVAAGYAAIVEKQIGGWDASHYLPKFGAKLDRDGKITAILSKVNGEIRYTGVEFGEASIVPRSPVQVLERKYGDCKDKSALVVALLRAAKIDAHVALLLSSTGSDIEPDMPALNVFNHAIVYVPGTPDLWLDPTDSDLRLGVMAPANQGRLALIASEKTTGLVRTPESTSAENRVVETREFFLSELGPARVVETSETWGTGDRDYRGQWGQLEQKKIQEDLKDYADWTYAAPGVASASHSDPDDLTKPFQLRLEFKDAKRGTTAEAEAAVAIRLSQVAYRLPEFFRKEPKDKGEGEDKATEAKRTDDFVIPEAFVAEWRYRIVPPPGFRARQSPEQSDQKLGPASLSVRFQTEADGVVTGTVKFDMPKRRFTAAEGLALRDAYLALEKKDIPFVSFEQAGETLLASGKVKEALVEFRELEKRHPTEALHCHQVARALLAAGAGEAARAEARRGVTLEPKSAKAYANLAVVLKHDLVGRELKKGYDRDGAVAAYRKALEIDPADDATRANLAILLEYDEAGKRYAAGAQLGEAIAEYRKIEAKLAGLGLPQNLVVAMFRAGQMKEVREYLHKQPASDANRSLELAATAALDGPAAAIEAAGREIAGVKQQQAALFTAAQSLLVARLYAPAADLFAAGSSQSANPAATQNLAEILHRTRRVEDTVLKGDKPEDALRRLLIEVINGDFRKPGAIASMYSRRARKSLDAEEMERAGKSLKSSQATLARSGLTLEVGLDLVLSMMKVSVDGNDEAGYTLRAVMPGVSAGQTVSYAVREDGQYRLIDAFGDWDGVARMVLDLAEADQVEAARAWLDRAREELQTGGVDDPLSPPLFARVWTKGQNGDKTAVRRAAAVLLASTGQDAATVPILQEAYQSAQKADERQLFAAALVNAYMKAKDYGRAADLAASVLDSSPKSQSAFTHALESSAEAGDRARTERLVAEHIEQFKTDAAALRAAAVSLLSVGANERAAAILETLMSSGKAEARDYNQVAWSDLESGAVTDATSAAIQQAMLLSKGEEPPILHTLAAIQAETGKPGQARVTILQRMDLSGSDEPDDDDWYVFGRIAEAYGLPDAAKTMYAKLARPKDQSKVRMSTYALAQRRVDVLGKPAGK